MKYKIHSIIFVFFIIVFVTGCGTSNNEEKTKSASSFVIEQTDTDKAGMILPGSFPGTDGKINFKADIKVVSKGTNSDTVLKTAKYDYLNEWTVSYVYDEIWDQIGFDAGALGHCAISKNEIQYLANLKFDLSTIDKDGNFTVKVENPSAHVDKLYMVCIGSYGTQTIPASGMDANYASIFTKGKISNMTENSAVISFPDSYIYNSGIYKTISKPMVLKIKKK